MKKNKLTWSIGLLRKTTWYYVSCKASTKTNIWNTHLDIPIIIDQ